MTTNSDLYTSRLPDGLLLITVENVRDEMKRIGELGRAGDFTGATSVRYSLMLNGLLAVHLGHPEAKAIVGAIVGEP